MLSQILENNSPRDIAVLSFEKGDIINLSRITDSKGRSVSFTSEVSVWESGGKILKATVQSFKGLEANIVVLFMSKVAQINEKLRYVAESRAKYGLYIVEEDDNGGNQLTRKVWCVDEPQTLDGGGGDMQTMQGFGECCAMIDGIEVDDVHSAMAY